MSGCPASTCCNSVVPERGNPTRNTGVGRPSAGGRVHVEGSAVRVKAVSFAMAAGELAYWAFSKRGACSLRSISFASVNDAKASSKRPSFSSASPSIICVVVLRLGRRPGCASISRAIASAAPASPARSARRAITARAARKFGARASARSARARASSSRFSFSARSARAAIDSTCRGSDPSARSKQRFAAARSPTSIRRPP